MATGGIINFCKWFRIQFLHILLLKYGYRRVRQSVRNRATQFDLSYLKYFDKKGFEFSASAYYKKFNGQIDYEDHATVLINPLVAGELRFGSGRAYGVEFFIKKETGRLTGRMGYDFSRVNRHFADLNAGEKFDAFQDRPHDFSLLVNYRLKRRIFLSGYWTASTGSPFSSPTGFYNFNSPNHSGLR